MPSRRAGRSPRSSTGRPPKEEAEGVKRWLVAIAQRTAEAAKEGGFLGIGGTRVSENETVAIRDVARALGVAPPA